MMQASVPEPYTGCDHEHDDRVIHAAQWLRASGHVCPRPILPQLRATFGLSTLQAIEAMGLACGRGAHAGS